MNVISDIKIADVDWFSENLYENFWLKFSPLNVWETNIVDEAGGIPIVVETIESFEQSDLDNSYPIYSVVWANSLSFVCGISKKGQAVAIPEQCSKEEHALEKASLLTLEIIAYVNCVLQTFQEKVTTQKTRLPARYQQLENGQTIKTSDPRKVKLYTLPDLRKVKGLKSAIKKVRRCLCWETRGHWRHYQNGKTIWIKPCVKGPDRLKYKPKGREYDLGTSL